MSEYTDLIDEIKKANTTKDLKILAEKSFDLYKKGKITKEQYVKILDAIIQRINTIEEENSELEKFIEEIKKKKKDIEFIPPDGEVKPKKYKP